MVTAYGASHRCKNCRGLGGARSEYCRTHLRSCFENHAVQGKEKHAAQLLREPAPAPGAVKLDKTAEATKVVPALEFTRVDKAAEKTQRACRSLGGPHAGLDNEKGEQNKRMKLSVESSMAAGIHVCLV